jgi:alanine racemase
MDQLRELIAFLSPHRQIKIHLKIDTGMHRLGFMDEEWASLCDLLVSANQQIKVQSIFTHLAASDVSKEDAFSKQQIKEFDQAYKYITKHIKHKCDRHVLNTSGILRFSQYQYEMVRIGIGLYGIDPTIGEEQNLKEVLSFKASISQIKYLKKGDTIGYNRKGKVNKGKKIAIINVGYADGLLRKAGNGRFKVLINGQEAPTIGNICMDMSMIDISHIDNVSVNDEVIIFGNEHSVQHLCKSLDTIAYEVFTGVSERIKRVYNQE